MQKKVKKVCNRLGSSIIVVAKVRMAVSNFSKLRLLLWKNFLLQRRHIVQTLFEISLPLIFMAILATVRGLVNPDVFEDVLSFPPWSPADVQGNRIGENLIKLSSPNGMSTERPFTVFYAPDNDETERIMEILRENYLQFPSESVSYNVTSFKTQESLLNSYKSTEENVLGAIAFYKLNETIEYAIRLPSKLIKVENGTTGSNWMTDLVFPTYQRLGPRDYNDDFGGQPGYYSQCFLYLQYAVDTSILHYLNNSISIGPDGINEYKIDMQRYPHNGFTDDFFMLSMQGSMPLALMLSLIYHVVNTTKSIVLEKEKRMKESLKIMGLPDWMHLTAWFVKSFIPLFISSVFVLILLKVKWKGGLALFTAADPSVVFVFLIVYAWSAIFYCFLVASIFSKANSAATAAGIFWFLIHIPHMFLHPRYDRLALSTKVGASLFLNTGMAFGVQVILMFEGSGAGVQWDTIMDGVSPQDPFSLLQSLLLLFFDGLIYLLLAVYIESVWPGDYGVPLPWYFPLTKSYWLGTSQKAVNFEDFGFNGKNINNYNHNPFVENVPSAIKAGIRIQALTKRYGDKVAVNKLSLDMYENQVTALLGHNGAGKTTTMSMLAGIFPPTSGTAIINNCDIRWNIKGVRDSLGLCPQHDVLFDELTVQEHLEFFCLLKGCAEPRDEVNRMITALGLEPKRNAQSQTLSGGMKRKLSLGIALIGGSKVVLLDEPTSGMDPAARRSTWDLITSEKKNRTILLSTHFMDEADLLGDRIAIVAHGQLQTVGSSLFLKKNFGGGYHLIIVKKEGCDPSKITNIIKHLVCSSVEVEQDIGAELSYSLPDDRSGHFADLFEELEKRKDELYIDSYGASSPTMEEVFMRVGRAAEEKIASRDGSSKVIVETRQQDSHKYQLYEKVETNTGSKLILQQLYAMIVKKVLFSLRNRILLTVQTGIPVIYLIIVLTMLSSLPGVQESAALPMNLDKFGYTITSVSCIESDIVCSSYRNFAESVGSTVNKVENLVNHLLSESERDIVYFNYHDIVALSQSGNTLTAMFNNQPFHSPPVALSFVSNAFLQAFVNSSRRIVTFNHPLPLSVTEEAENTSPGFGTGFQIGFNVIFGMSFLASSFVVFLIRERESRAKHLQFVSGAKFWVFWLANWIVDVVNYLLPSILVMIVMVVFRTETFTESDVLASEFVLLLAYGWAVIPQSYVFSFWFKTPASGFTRMVTINFLSGLGTFLIRSLLTGMDGLDTISDALDWVFMIFPNYNLGWGVSTLSRNSLLHEVCPQAIAKPGFCQSPGNEDNSCCTQYERGYLDWETPGIGRNILFLFFVGLFSMIAVLIEDSKISQKIFSRSKSSKKTTKETDDSALDSDVIAETNRIQNTEISKLSATENLILHQLAKRYKSLIAVRGLNLGVGKKECFGLLGANGAGKTTTFKMLTGDLPVSSGDAYIRGHSVTGDIKKVQQHCGYCPQFDAVLEELTGRETIRLFARLRGVKEGEIDALVEKLGAHLLFSEHMDKRVGAYSGGNKRKLSTALALIGNPPIVYLDEPTTGMDPVARRHLWNCINKVREAGTSIVLTSHSMEECEALCTRLTIMVNGQFRCLGSVQHLKSKFGEGYTVIVQLNSSSTNVNGSAQGEPLLGNYEQWEQKLQPLKNYIEEAFPGAIVKDIHPGYLHYHVTNAKLRWSYLFKKMEEAKENFNLEAYSVGQTTLEQVFINFTKNQETDY